MIHSMTPASWHPPRAVRAGSHRDDAFPRPTALAPDHNCNVVSLAPAAQLVQRIAARIEPDPREVMHWYRKVPITELDQLTAAELVVAGRAEAVIKFLQAIGRGQRD